MFYFYPMYNVFSIVWFPEGAKTIISGDPRYHLQKISILNPFLSDGTIEILLYKTAGTKLTFLAWETLPNL